MTIWPLYLLKNIVKSWKEENNLYYTCHKQNSMDVCSPAAELLAQLLSRRATKPHGVSGHRILYLDLCIKTRRVTAPYWIYIWRAARVQVIPARVWYKLHSVNWLQISLFWTVEHEELVWCTKTSYFLPKLSLYRELLS